MSSATRFAGERDTSTVHAWDSLHYWLIFAFSFPVQVALAVGHRLSPRYWLRSVPHGWLLTEAWMASATTARIAFSG